MSPYLFFMLLVVESVANAQDLPMAIRGIFGGWEPFHVLPGDWLRALSAPENHRAAGISQPSGKLSSEASHEPPARLVQWHAKSSFSTDTTCNYTSCCSTRTSISLARRAAATLQRLGAPAPLPLLVCGPASHGPTAAPCHPPLGAQPLLRGLRTRLSLSLHILQSRLVDINPTYLTSRAWVKQLRQVYQQWLQRPQLLALPPSAPSGPPYVRDHPEVDQATDGTVKAAAGREGRGDGPSRDLQSCFNAGAQSIAAESCASAQAPSSDPVGAGAPPISGVAEEMIPGTQSHSNDGAFTVTAITIAEVAAAEELEAEAEAGAAEEASVPAGAQQQKGVQEPRHGLESETRYGTEGLRLAAAQQADLEGPMSFSGPPAELAGVLPPADELALGGKEEAGRRQIAVEGRPPWQLQEDHEGGEEADNVGRPVPGQGIAVLLPADTVVGTLEGCAVMPQGDGAGAKAWINTDSGDSLFKPGSRLEVGGPGNGSLVEHSSSNKNNLSVCNFDASSSGGGVGRGNSTDEVVVPLLHSDALQQWALPEAVIAPTAEGVLAAVAAAVADATALDPSGAAGAVVVDLETCLGGAAPYPAGHPDVAVLGSVTVGSGLCLMDVATELAAAGMPPEVAAEVEGLLAVGGGEALTTARQPLSGEPLLPPPPAADVDDTMSDGQQWVVTAVLAAAAEGMEAAAAAVEAVLPDAASLQEYDACHSVCTAALQTASRLATGSIEQVLSVHPPGPLGPAQGAPTAVQSSFGDDSTLESPAGAPAVGLADGGTGAWWVPPSEQLLALLTIVGIAAAVQAVAVATARRQAAQLLAALAALQNQYNKERKLVLELQNHNAQLQELLSAARGDVERQCAARVAALRLAAAVQRAVTVAVVQIAQRVPELERSQLALATALEEALREGRMRWEALAVALEACRRRWQRATVAVAAQRAAAMAAEERAAVAERDRRQAEEARAAAQAAEGTGRLEMEALRRRLEEDLADERRCHSATAAAAEVRQHKAAEALRRLRQRQGRVVRAWLAMRAWLGLQVAAVAERAGQLAEEHRWQFQAARDTLERHRAQSAVLQRQLEEQVAVRVDTERINDDLLALLSDKDSTILQLEGEKEAAVKGLQSERQKCDFLQTALTGTQDELTAARQEAVQLAARLEEAQAAAIAAEARANMLDAANHMLDKQVKEFYAASETLVQLQEKFLAPTQAKIMVLKQQIAAEREAAAAAQAAVEAKLAASEAALAETKREMEAAQRARADLATRLDQREAELSTLRAEVAESARREEEGLENALAAATQRDREQEAVIRQLLGPLAGLPVTLPADAKTIQGGGAVASPMSAAAAAAAAAAALAHHGQGHTAVAGTPASGSYSGSGAGGGGGSSASGVRGAGAFAFGVGAGRK